MNIGKDITGPLSAVIVGMLALSLGAIIAFASHGLELRPPEAERQATATVYAQQRATAMAKATTVAMEGETLRAETLAGPAGLFTDVDPLPEEPFTPTPTATATPDPTSTPTATPTPTAPSEVLATDTPTSLPAELSVVVAGESRLNVRVAPDTGATILDVLEPGTVVTAVGRTEDAGWLQVRLPESDTPGWLSTSFVTFTESLDILPVVEGD